MTDTTEPTREILAALDPSTTQIGRPEAERSAPALHALPAGATVTMSTPGGFEAALPPAVVDMIAMLLHEASAGHVVALVSATPEVTTTQAASLLGVSRPHVAKLVDSGSFPRAWWAPTAGFASPTSCATGPSGTAAVSWCTRSWTLARN